MSNLIWLFLELPFSVSLPPRLGLYSVSEPVGSILERNSTYKSAQSIRPVRVSQKCAKDRAAEELASSSDLWRDREFPEPAIVLASTAARVIKAALERERKALGEENLRPRAERRPLVPAVLRISIPRALKNEDWHDGKLVVRLKQNIFGKQESRSAVDKSARLVDRRAEVAGGPGAVLKAKRVIPTMPFQSLMANSERITAAAWDDLAGRCR